MMNSDLPKVKTVGVLLVNVDDRQFAMLRMAFKMHNTISYQLLNDGATSTPDLILVDGDSTGGNEQYQLAKQRYPSARVVYFSRKPPVFTAPYLAKPIKFDTLFANLRNLQQGNGVWLPNGRHPAESELPPSEPPLIKTASVHAQGMHIFQRQDKEFSFTQEREHPIRGEIKQQQESGNLTEEPHFTHNQSISITRFNVQPTLLGHLLEVSRQEQDMALMVDGKPVLLVFPSVKKVLLAAESDVLQRLCEKNALVATTRPVPENGQLQEKAKISLQSCIWQLAIWTSQGRLIEPILPTTVLRLKAWPNMTRLAYLPDAIRLSAFLVRAPVTLAALYKLLPIDMGNLLNYVTATYTTGFLDIEQSLDQKIRESDYSESVVMTRGQQQEQQTSGETKQVKGLLSRLMSHLKGK